MDSHKDIEYNKKKALDGEQTKQLKQKRRLAIEGSIRKLLEEVKRLSLDDLALMEMQKKYTSIEDPLENSEILKLNTDIQNNLSSDHYLADLGLNKDEYETPIICGDEMPDLLAPILLDIKNKNSNLINDETLFKLQILSGISNKLYNCAVICIAAAISEAILKMNTHISLDDFTEDDMDILKEKINEDDDKRNNSFQEHNNKLQKKTKKIQEEWNYLNKPYHKKDLHDLQSAEKLANKIIKDLNKNKKNKSKFIENIIYQCQKKLDDRSLFNLTFYLMKLDIAAFSPTGGDDLYLRSSSSNWRKLYNICAKRFDYYYYQDQIPPQMHLLNQLVVGLYSDPNKYVLENEQRLEMATRDLSFAGLTNSIPEVITNKTTKENIQAFLIPLQKMQKIKIESINEKFDSQAQYVNSLLHSELKNEDITSISKITPDASTRLIYPNVKYLSKIHTNIINASNTFNESNRSKDMSKEKTEKINQILSICQQELIRLHKEQANGYDVNPKIAAFKALMKYIRYNSKNDQSIKDIIKAAKNLIVRYPRKGNDTEGSLIAREANTQSGYKSRITTTSPQGATLSELLSARRGNTPKLFQNSVKSRDAWNKIENIAQLTATTPELKIPKRKN